MRVPVKPLADAYYQGLAETYGLQALPGAAPDLRAAERAALARAAALGLHERSARLLAASSRHLPGPEPDLYVGPLFGIAPAATIAVGGRPAVAVGADRFYPAADRTQYPRRFYHPDELAEMVPHEAAHAARMEALALPPTPRLLTLLEMAMLEGTALLCADSLLGRRTLPSFLPEAQIAWHERHRPQVLREAEQQWESGGMAAFVRWFGEAAPVSGYWVGYDLCRTYQQRFGSIPLTVPSRLILACLRSPAQPDTRRA
jgi:hypothetical protein